VLLALVLFRQGDYYYARWAAKRALDLDRGHPQAHEVLGDVLYQDGNLDLAIPEWEAALERTPSRQAIQGKIDRARREMAVEEGFNRQVSRHFVLSSDGPIPREVTEAVLRSLEDAHYTLRRDLGVQPPGDITVVLYAGLVYHEVTGTPFWAGGSFDGKVRVPVGGIATEEEAGRLKPVLFHEMTHAFLRSMVPRGLPLWFEEGLAEHFEGAAPESARGWLAGHASARFATLAQVEAGLRGAGDVGAAYTAAYLAVATVVDEAGFAAVRRLLEAMSTGVPFERALETEARLTIPELQERWRKAMP
jgi:hypothetical protein